MKLYKVRWSNPDTGTIGGMHNLPEEELQEAIRRAYGKSGGYKPQVEIQDEVTNEYSEIA